MLKDIVKSTSIFSEKFTFKNNKIQLDKLFEPKTIGVIGASNNLAELGGKIFSNLNSNKNLKVFPINLAWANIQNTKAYTNLISLERELDLIIITIEDIKSIIFTIKDAIKMNISNILILSEIKKNNLNKLKIEIELLNDKKKLNILGLNSNGFVNIKDEINISNKKIDCIKGDFSFVCSNIEVYDALIDYSLSERIGFSKIIDLGNCDFFSFSDVLNYLKDDISTKEIILAIDENNLDSKFEESLIDVVKFKRVIVFSKSNSSSKLLNEIIGNTGAIFANDVDELTNLIKISNSKNKFKINHNIFTISNSKFLSSSFDKKIKENNINKYLINNFEKNNFDFLRNNAEIENPIVFNNCFSSKYISSIFNSFNQIEVGFIILLVEYSKFQDYDVLVNEIIRFSKISNKVILVNIFGGEKLKCFNDKLRLNKIPIFTSQIELISTLKEINSIVVDKNLIIQDYYSFDETRVNFVNNELKKYSGNVPQNLIFEIFNNILAINVESPIIINSLFEINNIFLENDESYTLRGIGVEIDNEKLDDEDIVSNITFDNFKGKIHHLFDKMFEKYNQFYIKFEKERVGLELKLEIVESSFGDFINIKSKNNSSNEEILIKIPTDKDRIKDKLVNSRLNNQLNQFRGTKDNLENLYEIINRISNLKKLFKKLVKINMNSVILNENGVFLDDINIKIERFESLPEKN